MNKNIILSIILTAIIIGSGAFYGGMKYAQAKNPGASANFANLTPGQRQQRAQQMGGAKRTGNNAQGANFINGDIISKDDKSVTIKMQDGGSKIVFYSLSTPIKKSADGVASDLEIGKQVMISGSQNQDGSITAQNIQIRN